ncbi:MAG: gamma carbonic anhydrase family protein [Rhodospirillales bacterium]|nr:gamma carbonic anhydrase family protein [Rhodospirillales bacterium]
MTGRLLPYRGRLPRFAERVFIAPGASVIGDVEIGVQSSIWFGCVVRGDVNIVRIGARTNIQDGTVVHVSKDGQGTFLGSDITVGHMALLHACTVEDGAFVGMRATIMDDCLVEAGAMVAAGALVTPGKRVRTGELWAGTPAKKIRDLNEQDRTMIAKLAPRYVALAADYLAARDGAAESVAANAVAAGLPAGGGR